MERRLLLALTLSFLFMIVYQGLFVPRDEPLEGDEAADPRDPTAVAQPADGSTGEPATASPSASPGAAVSATPGTPSGTPTGTSPAALPGATLAEHREVDFAGAGMTARFTSTGAGVASVFLEDYPVSVGSDEPLQVLGAVDPSTPSFVLRDLRGRYPLESAEWEFTGDGVAPEFTYTTGDGLEFVKRFAPTGSDHLLSLELEIRNVDADQSSPLSLVLQGAQGVVKEDTGRSYYGQPAAIAVIDDGAETIIEKWAGASIDREDVRRIGEGERLAAVGAMTSYFAAVLLPEVGTEVSQVLPVQVTDRAAIRAEVAAMDPFDDGERLALEGQLAREGDHDTNARADVLLNTVVPPRGQSVRFAFSLFIGPKQQELAARPGYGFVKPLIEADYGSWGQWINRSLLWVLVKLHGLVGNWGVAIIMLTLLVRGLLFPLSRAQQTTMGRYQAKMQVLKPELDKLKEKHKNNQRKFSEEQMKLLREHGATPPLGGCLLMFLQFPIWISLFQLLGTAFELRHSSFVGWIADLSRPDRMPFGLFGLETINLVPLLMAVATVAQMWLQPKPADPQQAQTQKIMGMMMPLVMLFFLYDYAAGLSLYMLTSATVSIIEVHVIRRIWPVASGAPGPVAVGASAK